jgi:hypothetical protein
MPSPSNFLTSTGIAPLPDIGQLAYNGVTFSSLYTSKQSGRVVQDEAHRTTMFVEWTLQVDGHVTLSNPLLQVPGSGTDTSMTLLRQRLSAHAGTLTYTGRGFGPFTINPPGGGGLRDVAWGPMPKVLDFKPLGQGNGAFVSWQVTCRVPELPGLVTPAPAPTIPPTPGLPRIGILVPVLATVLQWNYECSLTFGEDGYSGLAIHGTLEVPITRSTVIDRTVPTTVDAFRLAWMNLQIDLTKFRVVRRSFNYSRDKRKCDWEYVAEELPPMGLPLYCTDARGTMSIRRSGKKVFLGAANIWTISLKATYTVRGDQPRRIAYENFCALWYYRMSQSANGKFTYLADTAPPGTPKPLPKPANPLPFTIVTTAIAFFRQLFSQPTAVAVQPKVKTGYAIPIDFSVDEGLYLDSKTVTFEAVWTLLTDLPSLLNASGIWRWLPGSTGGLWAAATLSTVMGSSSWLTNQLNPNQDVIVDLGGGTPPQVPFGG